PEQGHGFGIAGAVDALLGFAQRREVMAALIGGIGGIARVLGLRRRRCGLRWRRLRRRLLLLRQRRRDKRRRGDGRDNRGDDRSPSHPTSSIVASRPAASANAAAGPRGSLHRQSPTATKSAPACASGPTSSRAAAKATHGG